MIIIDALQGQTVLIYGLGLSGLSAVRACLQSGASVIAGDDDPARFADLPDGVKGISVEEIEWDGIDRLVLAPGIPHYLPSPHPVAVKAGEYNIPIIGDIELLALAEPSAQIIGVTGTNGKSTTTSLIAHVMSGYFDHVEVGGNLGRPVLDFEPDADIYVIELSSYQLERCPSLSVNVAVWLNISPDHLDRHGDMERYVDAKFAIFNNGQPGESAVIAVDDSHSKTVSARVEKMGERQLLTVSANALPKYGYGVSDGQLFFQPREGDAQIAMDLRLLPRLNGSHNHQNIAACWAACAALGVPNHVIAERIESFEGLPHRQFLSRMMNGVAYINDSKATNAVAASRALNSYESIHWIVGGQPKEGGLKGVEPYLSHVRKAYLIGEAAEEFAAFLNQHAVEYEICGLLDHAVASAHQNAQAERGLPGKSPVVLLAPACASFDQYRSFVERGDAFQALVDTLS